MSYQTDDGKHEGWDAAEFPDGRFSVGSGDGGTLVRFVGPDLDASDVLADDLGRGVVDGRTAIGWRGLCECGWRGPLWRKVADTGQHDPAAHRIYDAAPSVYGDAPGGIEDAIYQEWRGHLPPQSLADVRAAAEDMRKAEDRLDDAVRRARQDGSSWADIGDAAGIARQSAHERWAKRWAPFSAAEAAYIAEHGSDDLETGHVRDPEGDEAAHA